MDIETPEEFAQKVKDYCFDAWTMNREQGQYMGEFDLDEATRLITDFTALIRADERQKAAERYCKECDDGIPELTCPVGSSCKARAAIMAEPKEAV
jgi:hypothetical protein